MTNSIKEKKFKSLQQIIDYLDNSVVIEESADSFLDDLSQLEVIKFNGNELDVLKLIKKYGLNFKSERCGRDYAFCARFPQTTPNTYCVGPKSMYGHIPYKLNIKGHCVNITKSAKTNYEQSYISKRASGITKDEKYVILDIETTGLEPILDDIIQICIYENEKNYISRYLPLEKRERNIAYNLNHIEDDLLQKQRPLSQEEVDKVIEELDL